VQPGPAAVAEIGDDPGQAADQGHQRVGVVGVGVVGVCRMAVDLPGQRQPAPVEGAVDPEERLTLDGD